MYRSDLIAAQVRLDQLQAEIARRDARIACLERRLDQLRHPKPSLWQRLCVWFKGDALASVEERVQSRLEARQEVVKTSLCPYLDTLMPCADCDTRECEVAQEHDRYPLHGLGQRSCLSYPKERSAPSPPPMSHDPNRS